MTGQALANTALACAVLGHKDERLLTSLLQEVQQRQPQSGKCSSFQFNMQALCSVCWCVAVLDQQQLAGSVLSLVQAVRISQQQWVNVVDEGLTQLQQVHLWLLDKQLVDGRGLAGALTQQQLQQCKDACNSQHQARAAKPPSAAQQQVFAAFQQLTAAGQLSWQQPPAMEQLAAPDGACLIDIAAVTADGVRLATEFDGPTHFLWPGRRLDGPSQFRNRLLAARGYAVVCVPYYEWNKRAKGKRQQPSAEQVQYLLQLVVDAVKQLKNKVQQKDWQAAPS
jgi:hypothetical protein